MKHITNAIPIILLGIGGIMIALHVNTIGNEVDTLRTEVVEIRDTINAVRDDIKDITLYLDEYQSNQASATLKTK